MTPSVQPAPRAFSTAFGLLMAAAAAFQADGLAIVAVMLAVIAVLAGLQFRAGATLAVLLAVAAIAISDPSPLFAALSGLSATAYLLLRHAVGSRAGVTTTGPTVVAVMGFTLAGLLATLVPTQVPWLPLLAPLLMVGIYALVVRPFLAE
jgi:hypothetical protein